METKIAQLKQIAVRPPTPGEVLQDILDDSGLTQGALAERLGVTRQTINHLLNNKRSLTPDMAHRLAHFFGNGPELWLNLQSMVDLWDALHMDTHKYREIEPLQRRAA